MRWHLTPEPLLYLITTFLLAPHPLNAEPHPHPSSLKGFAYNEIFARWDCESGTVCGWHDRYCCQAGSGCYTNAQNIAVCTPNARSSWAPVSSWAPAPVSSWAPAPSGSGRCNPCNSEAVPGVRKTSIAGVTVTQTSQYSSVVPYQTPVATGANVTMTELDGGGGGLSGGAIAGIVIGVLVGLLILGIICFYCCIKGIFDGVLAIFGVGRKRKVTEVDEYTRRTHHSSGGGKRTWYGAPAKSRKKVEKKDSHLGELVGLGAGLAGLWAILGLKRRREDRKRHDEKYSEYSYSSDYYTSSSSASSDDRRSGRYDRSVRRSESRR